MRLRLTALAAVTTLLCSIGLHSLFVSGAWFWTGVGAILVVSAAGVLVRRFRPPALVNLLAGTLALLIYLTVVFAGRQAYVGVVPTGASMARLGELVTDGWHAANNYAAPVPRLPGITLIAGLGIGIVAVLVDFCAVRLRHTAPAGLPLLAMYTLPAAIRQESAGWPAFLLGAAGFLALLLADSRERLTGWGRLVFTRRWSNEESLGERPDSTPLAAAGRRIGATALAVAVLIPVTVPGIEPKGLFGSGQGDGHGHDRTTITTPDPLVSLRRRLVSPGNATVLTYSTTGTPSYLRMYSLDRFDGGRWTYTPLRGGKKARVQGKRLPKPQGLSSNPGKTAHTKITISRDVDGMNVLPAPYPPTRIDIKGDWRVDKSTLMVFSLHDSASGRSYSVDSLRLHPTARRLQAAGPPPPKVASRYLRVPNSVPVEVTRLTHKLTAKARTPYEKAIKLQKWFTEPDNFTYSLTTPPTKGVGGLRDFLFVSRTGYCEQFAASMALMARIAGIPARVAVGYTAGTRRADGDWVVRTQDTHAWPELYFDGVGWLRFEPTPTGPQGQGTATIPDYAFSMPPPGLTGRTGGKGSPSSSTGSGTGSAAASNRPRHRPDPIDAGAPVATPPRPAGSSGPPLGWLVAALIVALALVTPLSMRLLGRRRRWARATDDGKLAGAAWAEVRITAVDHGLPWRVADTPRAAARGLIARLDLDDAARRALLRIARLEERARYARSPEPTDTLRADVRMVRAAFAGTATWTARWRARLVPPSAIAALRGLITKSVEAAGRFDLTGVIHRRLPSRGDGRRA